jgi:hypothetical protein
MHSAILIEKNVTFYRKIFIVYNMYKVTVRDIVEARAPELRSRNEFDVLGNYKIPDT